MGADLGNLSAVHYHNPISTYDSCQTMGNDEHGAPFHKIGKGLL